MLPKTVQVRGAMYRVEVSDQRVTLRGRPLRGYCDGRAKLIYVYKRQSLRRLRSTFMHELLHAIQFEYKIKIPHSVIAAYETPLVRLFEENASMRGAVRQWTLRPAKRTG